MEVQVKIERVLEVQSFQSKKGDGVEYHRYSFVGRTVEQYPRVVCFTCMGDDLWAKMGIVVGGEYSVGFNLQSREYNGRWYTDVSVWKATRLDDGGRSSVTPNQQAAVAQQPQPTYQQPLQQAQQQVASQNGSDLPF